MKPPGARAGEEVLSQRMLNRATLDRQLLLERSRLSAAETVEWLVGLQAQTPHGPYVSLWTRLEGFDPMELSGLLADRKAVRGTLMRATIHLATARDYLEWRPLLQPVVARTFKGSAFSKRIAGAELDELLAAGREVVEAEPRLRAEISRLLAERWPDCDGDSLGYAVTFLVPLVQVTPRGLWGEGGQARLTTPRVWLGRELEPEPSIDAFVIRYLGALGPASVKDIQNWCGLTRLKEVVERLRPGLRSFRAEDGRELFDLPDAPRPDPETPAPPRFLPEYDNVLLGHADRSRFFAGDARDAHFFTGSGANNGTLLVDGLLKATWKITVDGDRATLLVRPFKPLSKADVADVEEEGAGLLSLVAADAGEHAVRVDRSPRQLDPAQGQVAAG